MPTNSTTQPAPASTGSALPIRDTASSAFTDQPPGTPVPRLALLSPQYRRWRTTAVRGPAKTEAEWHGKPPPNGVADILSHEGDGEPYPGAHKRAAPAEPLRLLWLGRYECGALIHRRSYSHGTTNAIATQRRMSPTVKMPGITPSRLKCALIGLSFLAFPLMVLTTFKGVEHPFRNWPAKRLLPLCSWR
jgi:hypothetical protein